MGVGGSRKSHEKVGGVCVDVGEGWRWMEDLAGGRLATDRKLYFVLLSPSVVPQFSETAKKF